MSNKEKKIFQADKKEICITSSQIKQAIDLLVNENKIFREEIERLNNIIAEAIKYIDRTQMGEGYKKMLLEILKENK